MKYLSSAVNYAIKNWMLILPVFVLIAIVNLIGGVGSALGLSSLTSLANTGNYTDPSAVFSALSGIIGAAAGAGIIAALAKFIYGPATYGLVNKSLDTGNAGLNDLGAVIGGNFVKYVIYFVGTLVVGAVAGLGGILVVGLLGLVFSLLGGFGTFLTAVVFIAVVLFWIALSVLLSLWFAAMIVDGLDVVAAAKKSIEIIKGCFWTVLGITILVAVVCGIAGWILGFVARIPLLGPIIYSVVPAAQYFVMAVFYLLIYREKTDRASAA